MSRRSEMQSKGTCPKEVTVLLSWLGFKGLRVEELTLRPGPLTAEILSPTHYVNPQPFTQALNPKPPNPKP